MNADVRRVRWCRRRRERICASDSGYAVMEFVVVLPLAVMAMFTLFQYGLWWHARNVSQAAAQDGLRAVRSFQGTPGAGEAAAIAYLNQVAPNLMRDASVAIVASPTAVTVTITAQPPRVLSFVPVPVIRETASGPKERFTSTSDQVETGPDPRDTT